MKVRNPKEILEEKESLEYKRIREKYNSGDDISEDIKNYNNNKNFKKILNISSDGTLYKTFNMKVSFDLEGNGSVLHLPKSKYHK